MSQAIRVAVAAQMLGDAPPAGTVALPKLLAPHPADPTKPAIFNATKSNAPVVYDCLTYRIEQATPDKRFQPGLIQPGQTYTAGVEDFYLDMEAWTQTPDSAPLDAINARLDALFHFQAFATTTGPVFRTECIMRQTDLYDKTLRAWFSISRYRMRFQQTS